MKFNEWFQPTNIEHIKAVHDALQTGTFQTGSIPDNVTRSPNWHIHATAAMANEFMKLAMAGKIEGIPSIDSVSSDTTSVAKYNKEELEEKFLGKNVFVRADLDPDVNSDFTGRVDEVKFISENEAYIVVVDQESEYFEVFVKACEVVDNN